MAYQKKRTGFVPQWDTLYPGSETSDDAIELGRAVDIFCRAHGKLRPTDFELLLIAKSLGWEMAKTQEFVLIQDDDSHWYICPADKEKEASAILAAITKYWAYDPGNEKNELPTMPDWLRSIGGSPSLVKFQKPRVESA